MDNQPTPEQPLPPVPPDFERLKARRKKNMILAGFAAGIAAMVVSFIYLPSNEDKPAPVNSNQAAGITPPVSKEKPAVATIQLDEKKNYGNKYADGLLPVGDGKYSTSKAKTGEIYACDQYAKSFKSDAPGAGTRGPWFTNNNTQYDITKKAMVAGNVSWQPSMSNKISGNSRVISTNDLPEHHTGTFPVDPSDPAYAYDRNPNRVSTHDLTYTLSASPNYSNPQCIGGEVGVMLSGVALFSAFDAGGRDAGAWEVQDDCSGHPQKEGEYHYHTLSSCITDASVKTVIGFALDGFPITGPKVADNNFLTTGDLDECHGITSNVMLDGKETRTYHYVMTQDFPYSVSCYRSKPIQPPHAN